MKLNSFSFHMNTKIRKQHCFDQYLPQYSSVPLVCKLYTRVPLFACVFFFYFIFFVERMWILRFLHPNWTHAYSNNETVSNTHSIFCKYAHECLLTLISWVYGFLKMLNVKKCFEWLAGYIESVLWSVYGFISAYFTQFIFYYIALAEYIQ